MIFLGGIILNGYNSDGKAPNVSREELERQKVFINKIKDLNYDFEKEKNRKKTMFI